MAALIQDSVMAAMAPALAAFADRLLGACATKQPLFCRFHSDADGIAGALAVRAAIRAHGHRKHVFHSSSPIYLVQDADYDLEGVGRWREKPLALLLDFGQNPESLEGLRQLHSRGAEILSLDHHPFTKDAQQFCSLFLNPWQQGPGGSAYTAGFLAAEIARLMFERMPPAPQEEFRQLDRLAKAALLSDGSGLAVKAIAESERADIDRLIIVLQYLCGRRAPDLRLNTAASVLASEEEFGRTYADAIDRMDACVRAALANLKCQKFPNGLRFCVVKVAGYGEPGEFPSSATVTTNIHLKSQEEPGPVVTVGISGRSLSIRASREAIAAGFRANEVVENLKKQLKNAIISGGGHDYAASVRPVPGCQSIVIDALAAAASSL